VNEVRAELEQSVGTQLKPGMGKGANLYEAAETGWTDEARAVAAMARQHGFKAIGTARKTGALVYKHPKNGDKELHVNSDASWQHLDPRTGETHGEGKDADSMNAYMHGKRETAAVEVDWTDEARAAANAARGHGYKPLDPRGDVRGAVHYRHPDGHAVVVRPDGAWTHNPGRVNGTASKSGRGGRDLADHLSKYHGTNKEAAAVTPRAQMVRAGETQSGGKGPIPRGILVLGDQPQPVRQFAQLERPKVLNPRFSREEGRSHGDGADGEISQLLTGEAQEVGWTDAARAAAAVSRAHGYKDQTAPKGEGEGLHTFSHPNGHVIHVNSDGAWTHVPGVIVSGMKPASGRGGEQLQGRLLAYHGGKMPKEGEGGSQVTHGPGTLDDQRFAHDKAAFRNGPRLVRATMEPKPGTDERHGLTPGENPAGTADKAARAVFGHGADKGQDQGEPHDEQVPVKSFVDDLRQKIGKRRVMPGGDLDQDANPKPSEGEEQVTQKSPDGPVDSKGVPVPEQAIYTKEETNYRYASDPKRSCGECRFFVEPAKCRLVMGMILRTDVCDKFEPDDEVENMKKGGERNVVRASAVTESEKPKDNKESDMGMQRGTLIEARASKKVREAGLPYFARHKNGEMIGLEGAKVIARRMEALGYESPLGEVSPPGWEGTVKAMKKHGDITNPWALSWYMKNQGYTPHAGKKKENVPTKLIQKGREQGSAAPMEKERKEGAGSFDMARGWDRGLKPTDRLNPDVNFSHREDEEGAKVRFAGKKQVHFEPHKPHEGELDHLLHQARKGVAESLRKRVEKQLLKEHRRAIREGRGSK
jgi:hypothetical protein